MRVPLAARLDVAARRLSARAAVLMYHRVAHDPLDPWRLCVRPEHFDAQLARLRSRRRVVPLRQLVAEHRARRLPHGTVAITFDDGYADNATRAVPLLRRHGLPATCFLTAGAIGAGREFWWDELEHLLLAPGPLPPRLHLVLGDVARTWTLGAAAAAPPSGVDDAPWAAAPGTRMAFFHDVWRTLRPLGPDRQQAALARIRDQVGAPATVRESHRVMEPDEARALAREEGIEVGAHSVHHVPLSTLPPAVQREEIAGSRAALEALVGRPVASFAYPYGDRGAETPALVRRAGFESACLAGGGAVWRRADPFALPRVAVPDEDAAAFERRLAAVLD